MPWTSEEFQKKKKGLTKAQARKGSKVANSVLKTCLADNGGNCERKAIMAGIAAATGKMEKRKT